MSYSWAVVLILGLTCWLVGTAAYGSTKQEKCKIARYGKSSISSF